MASRTMFLGAENLPMIDKVAAIQDDVLSVIVNRQASTINRNIIIDVSMRIPALGYSNPSPGSPGDTIALPGGFCSQLTTIFDFKGYVVLDFTQNPLNPSEVATHCKERSIMAECKDLLAFKIPELRNFAFSLRQHDSKPWDDAVQFGDLIIENLRSLRHLADTTVEVKEIEAGRDGALSCIQSVMAPTHVWSTWVQSKRVNMTAHIRSIVQSADAANDKIADATVPSLARDDARLVFKIQAAIMKLRFIQMCYENGVVV